ncbi:hypothetical protein N7931_15035 [Catenovulum sp. 2E275]|uniref:hypothetical protein n=1 Tax=Catenovulum sp. 2E275 TaxID=2980497 RepID=UPI0021CE69D9|nr:hypothetical protein [Catenovulum sp. 2E275]MCU4676947.1 hypothetical protein [Catenovulum sp. 2E275]
MLRSIFVLFVALFSSQVLAHPDHSLGETAHSFYHAIFWIAFAAVVVKGISWYRNRKNQKQD